MKLKIADDLALPLDVVTEKLAFLGRTGSGKTYAAMKLAELMLAAGAQVGAIDPVGVWRALRVPAEKGGTSYEVVVFGGLYGDLPLEPTAGELIADLVCDRGLSFVLDVSQFIPSEQQRFVRAFADRFFHRKKSSPSAVHLFMEESQEFIPENPSGLEALTLGAMQRLWKLGRNFGIGGSLISQRPQEIAKKALNMSGTLFAFQMTGPQERKAIKAWVADHGVAIDIESVLQKLDRGQPHVESPTFLNLSATVRILPRVTADLSSTPKFTGASSTKAAARGLTPIDVEQLKTSMAATIEKQKADDPRELRKQIADLKAQLSKPAHIMREIGQATPKVVEKPVLKDGQLARAEKLVERGHALSEAFTRMVGGGGPLQKLVEQVSAFEEDFRTTAKEIRDAIDRTRAPQQDAPTPTPRETLLAEHMRTRPRMSPPAPRVPPKGGNNGHADGAVTGPQQRILNALAWVESVNLPAPRKEKAAVLADASPSSSSFTNNLGALRTAGLIDYPTPGYVALTDAGRGLAVVDTNTPTTSAEMLEVVCSKLTGPQARIVRAVAARYPAAIDKETLAGHVVASAASSSFTNNLGALRSLGIIDYPQRGMVAAQPVLFLEGR